MGENKEYITFPGDKGNINISEEVVSIISAAAAVEVEGVASLAGSGGKELSDRLGRKSASRGVKVQFIEDGITADIHILVKLNYAVNEVGSKVQEAVASAIESVTGFNVAAVNVHISGIVLEKA